MKKDIWEKKFSDNFKPDLWVRILCRLEVYRQDVIVSLLPKKADTLVDLACGNGELLFKAAERFEKLIGFDIAQNRITKAQKLIPKTVSKKFVFQKTDLDKGIPLESNTVDAVTCEASLSYFYDVEFILSEIKRILKPGGAFIVQVPNYAFLPRRIALLLGRLPRTSSFPGFGDGGGRHYFTYEILKDLLEKEGFAITAQTNSGVFPAIRRVWPQLLSGDIIYKAEKK